MPLLTKFLLLIILQLSLSSVNADELGRLFFTPQQRAQLDLEQSQPLTHNDPHNVISVSGIVQKHGGERIAWINGVPQTIGASNVQSPASVPVPVPGQSQPVTIKVGQKIFIRPSAINPDVEEE